MAHLRTQPAHKLEPAPGPKLPISQLESLRFKANQIVDTLNGLHFILSGAYDFQGRMPAWPEILSKYNIILSQTHNFTNSLVSPLPTSSKQPAAGSNPNDAAESANIFQSLAIYPNMPMTEPQLNFEIGPLLRNLTTTVVLEKENETVRRLSEHMQTKGSLALKQLMLDLDQLKRKQEPGQHDPALSNEISLLNTRMNQLLQDVIRECDEIRDAHDRLVDRAVKAVALLREKYDWKNRIDSDWEEDEEDYIDDHHIHSRRTPPPNEDVGMDSGDDDDDDDEDMGQVEAAAAGDKDGGSSSDDADENDVEQLMEKGFEEMPSPDPNFGSSVPGNDASTADAMQGVQ
ncbi:hypothetical protein H1R20_g13704, partial [Candolleomyces eurysporus]